MSDLVEGVCALVFSWPQHGPVSVLGVKGSKGLGLPGGKIEKSESPRFAVLRELAEETGYKYAVGRPLKSLPPRRADNWVLTHGFELVLAGLLGTPRGSHEGEPGWFSLTDMVRSPDARFPEYYLWAFRQCLGEEALRAAGFTSEEIEKSS